VDIAIAINMVYLQNPKVGNPTFTTPATKPINNFATKFIPPIYHATSNYNPVCDFIAIIGAILFMLNPIPELFIALCAVAFSGFTHPPNDVHLSLH